MKDYYSIPLEDKEFFYGISTPGTSTFKNSIFPLDLLPSKY
jgi:hypothetical protein